MALHIQTNHDAKVNIFLSFEELGMSSDLYQKIGTEAGKCGLRDIVLREPTY